VREAAFNLLGPLDGENVLDLFAGTGAMGIEALSRGAASATFVELDRAAHDVISRNLTTIIDRELHDVTLIKADARLVAQGARDVDGPFDLIIIDPPYRTLDQFIITSEGTIQHLLAPGGIVVVEMDKRSAELAERAADAWSLTVRTSRRYGDTVLALLEAE
jgi:16S rRNA (guanine(966)-N(2))-methyltransferase RsmD